MLTLLENSENHRINPSVESWGDGSMPAAVIPPWRIYLTVKVMVEWLAALLMVVATAPLVLVLAMVVKITSHGPAFYAQTRLGRDGQPFKLYKLRTMIHNAEATTGPVWAAKNDHRTTRFGSFLRKTHMDEFPQLFNVLRGEMGLIGPRPERPEIVARLEPQIPGYRQRLLARPGITGLAQMLVPADDPSDPQLRCVRKKVTHDIYYVRQVSLLLDVRIALCTVCHFSAQAIDSIRHNLMRSYGATADDSLAVEVAREPIATIHHRRNPDFKGVRPELRLVGEGELVAERASG